VVAKLGSVPVTGRGLPGVGSTSVVAKLGSVPMNGRGRPGIGSTSVVAKLGISGEVGAETAAASPSW
jgi:hypothetical protein